MWIEKRNRKERLPSNWNSLRARVLRRDDNKCQLCGALASQVDHIIPNDDHTLSNLRSLCRSCHQVKSSSEGNAAKRLRDEDLKLTYLRRPDYRFD